MGLLRQERVHAAAVWAFLGTDTPHFTVPADTLHHPQDACVRLANYGMDLKFVAGFYHNYREKPRWSNSGLKCTMALPVQC